MSLYHMIANRWVKPVIEKHQEEGRQEACREFQEWLNRQEEAESQGLSFDEPPPWQEK